MIDAATLLEALADEGMCVLPGVWPAARCAALLGELRAQDAAGALHPAGTGRGAGLAVRSELRGDRIAWLEAGGGPAAAEFLCAMQGLGRELAAGLRLAIAEYEAHFALYPPGGHYVKHLDRHRDSDARLISTVLYLNPDWAEDDGGRLRLWPATGESREALPQAGTLVVFRSDLIAHEVRPARRERCSIAGWFRQRRAAQTA